MYHRLYNSIFFPIYHGLYNNMFIPWPMDYTTTDSPHASWVVQQDFSPWPMNCTMVFCSMAHGVVQQYFHPMHHGLYNNIPAPCTMGCTTIFLPHGPWIVQQIWTYWSPMQHGLYNNIFTPWAMGHITLYNGTNAPWVMDCTIVLMPHVSLVVQWYWHPMGHGLYNSTNAPWVTGCTMVLIPHGSWIVQRCWHPMPHGLYNGTNAPWVMDCTMVCNVPKRKFLIDYISILQQDYQIGIFGGLLKQVT